MRTHKIVLWVLISVLIVSCGKKEKEESEAEKATYPILTGWLTADSIFNHLPEMKTEKEEYQPDSAAIAYLKQFNQNVNVLVMLGTWCSDSRREVPRFLKVMEEAGNDRFHYELFGLDRSKRDSLGLGEKNQIEYVPTFIIFQDSGEIGRIVETPQISIEQDLVDILTDIEQKKEAL